MKLPHNGLEFLCYHVWFLKSDDWIVVVWQQNEITREDFVRGARVIVGDQVLVQTIRLMHQKVSWLSEVLCWRMCFYCWFKYGVFA